MAGSERASGLMRSWGGGGGGGRWGGGEASDLVGE